MTDEKKNSFTKDTIFSVTPAHLSKVNKITQAPPPIRPVSGLGLVRTSTNKPHEKQEVFIPVDGVELTHQWAVDWKCLFDLARQGVLIPDEPKHIQNCIDCDFGMLSNYPPDEIDRYFSQWRYNPIIIEKFEAEHPDIIEAWQKKVKTSDNKEQKQDATETKPAPQTIPLSKEEAEEFIRSMAISYLSDTEVIIKTKNKEVKASCEDMGFKASSKPWAMFIKMLQNPKHEYRAGIYDKNKKTENLQAYNRESKLFPNFSKKFVAFINDQFSVTLPNDFNVFKNMKHIERAGTYKPKFQIFDHRELRQQKDIKSLSQEDTIEILNDLSKQLKRAKKQPEKELLFKEIRNYGEHAKRNGWITKNHEVWVLISPLDDTPSDNDIMALWDNETEVEKLF